MSATATRSATGADPARGTWRPAVQVLVVEFFTLLALWGFQQYFTR